MQLNQTQPSPFTVLLQLNSCYQVQTTVVSPDAHPSSYSSVATTLYPTLIYQATSATFEVLTAGLLRAGVFWVVALRLWINI